MLTHLTDDVISYSTIVSCNKLADFPIFLIGSCAVCCGTKH